MGSAQSTDSNEQDPWWPSNPAGCSNQVVCDNASKGEVLGRGDAWQHREQELCRTIQHLAEENMRLATAKREMEHEIVQAEKAHAEAHITIAMLNEELATLREGIQTERQQPIEKSVQTEAKRNEKTEYQIQTLLSQNEESSKEIDRLRRELVEKSEELEAIHVQFVSEKEAGKALLSEAEKLRTELQNIGTTKVGKTSDSAEPSPEPACAMDNCEDSSQETSDRQTSSERDSRVADELERFKAEISLKREARQRAMMAISSEMERLRTELAAEQESNRQLTEEIDRTRTQKTCNHDGFEELYKSLESERERNGQLAVRNECLSSELDSSEQSLTDKTNELEQLRREFDVEREQYCRKVSSLKEVVAISKQLLSIREKQVDDLELKLNNIEGQVGSMCGTTEERVTAVSSSVAAGLRQEYQTQLENIKSLKALYDERMRIITEEKDKLSAEFEEICRKMETEQKKSGELEIEVTNLKLFQSEREDALSSLETQLDISRDEARSLARELTLINNLFTQMLVSNNSSEIDLDKLTKSLQENHDLISEIMLKEDSSELAACLPKLLLELVAEIEKNAQNSCETPAEETGEESADDHKESKLRPCTSCQEMNTGDECTHIMAAEDIASNLPKVWKVLTELLSHHTTPTERPSDSNDDCCYKKVDTPYGPRLAISVSKTFLRLKDLILEKKSLRRELTQLKQLNCHLENRLSEQEQRLSLVSSELHKTWSVVGRMRTQHQQLHNHEKILRYELQQKRKLLNELKQELEYCRETWEMARQKNSQSEAEWLTLRKEFASRKNNSNSSLDNSGESGFSDDKEDDSGGEEGQSRLEAYCMPGPSESPPGNVPPDLGTDPTPPARSDTVPSTLGTPLVIDVTHEHLFAEEVCPLKSPPTPDFLESSAHVTVHDGDSAVDTAVLVECPVEKYCGLECSTISLISLLKQQLSCFSKNLEEITSDFGNDDNHQALQSIFFLPGIKVPYYEQTSDINRIKCANCSKEISNDEVDSTEVSPETTTKKKQCSFVLSESGTNNLENKGELVNNVLDSNPSSSITDSQMTLTHEDVLPCSTDSETSAVTDPESCAEENSNGFSADNDSQADKREERLGRTPEQVLEAREARLRRLEEQCRQLVKKVTNTTNRSAVLSSRLEELHGQYGEPSERGIPEPPPCPSVLPLLRIPETTVNNNAVLPPPPPHMPSIIPAFRIPTTMQHGQSSQQDGLEIPTLPTPET